MGSVFLLIFFPVPLAWSVMILLLTILLNKDSIYQALMIKITKEKSINLNDVCLA